MRNVLFVMSAMLLTQPASQAQETQPTASTAAPTAADKPTTQGEKPSLKFELSSNGLPTDGMWKCDPIFIDVNEDGIIDLACMARLGDGPHVFLGDGKGNWTDSSEGLTLPRSCGGGLAFEDINRDGHLDMAVADHCRGLFVFLGDGAGKWEMVASEIFPEDLVPDEERLVFYQGAEDIDVADVNGDGHFDLVAGASDDGGVSVFLGDGTGRNWTRNSEGLPIEGWATRVCFADVNRDGFPDIVSAYSKGPRVWLNSGSGTWIEASEGLPTPTLYGIYMAVRVADINNDGLLDIAIANWVDGPEVYFQREDGTWYRGPEVFEEMKGGAMGIDLADVNDDGNLDMALSGRLATEGGFVRGVFMLLGDGTGNWSLIENSGLPDTGLSATIGVALADFNGDGVPDIAASSGLIVETDANRQSPTLEPRLLVWKAIPDSTSVDEE